MKKTSLFLIAICFLLTACDKDSKNEWGRFYGFTADDINGHYNANPDESLYEELPSATIAFYNNTSIDISASGSAVTMHIVIPGVINKSFSGSIDLSDPSHSDLILHNDNNEDVMLSVYKNSKRTARLHGRVKHYYYSNTVPDKNWGFDVIKADN